MSIRTRTLIFSTFFGSCFAVGLLLASLTTNHWIRSTPQKNISQNPKGEIHFGLFSGTKDLNLGYVVHSRPINMYTFITTEPEVMNFWLWLLTALGTGFGLLSSAIAAISSVLKAASAAKKRGTMIVLFLSNISSASAQIVAFVCWATQFYQYLTHNVLAREDKNRHWVSAGLTTFGYSFYLLILSTIIVLINIGILTYAYKKEKWEKRRLEPPCEEKNQCSIMLY